MLISLFCFVITFWIQGIIAAAIVARFEKLSKKRRRNQITKCEEWEQGFYSLPLTPILQTLLSQNPVGMRIIITICLGISSLTTVIFTSSDEVIIFISLFLLAIMWLSLDI